MFFRDFAKNTYIWLLNKLFIINNMLPRIIQPIHAEVPEYLSSLGNFSGAQPGVKKILSAHKLDALVVLDPCTHSDYKEEETHVAHTLWQRSPKNLWLTTLFDRLAVRARCMDLNPYNIGFVAHSRASVGYICLPSLQRFTYQSGMTDVVLKDENSTSWFRTATLEEVGFEGIEWLQLEVIRRVWDNSIPSHIAEMPFSTSSIKILRDQFAALHKLWFTSDDIRPGSKFRLECARRGKLSAHVNDGGHIIIDNSQSKSTALFDLNERLDGMSHENERAMLLESDLMRWTKPEESFPVVLKHKGMNPTLPILRMIREE